MSQRVSLSQWWQQDGNPLVAIGPDGAKDFAALKADVSSWVAALSAQKGQRWAVYHHDAYTFLTLVLALWQLAKTVVVPGDNLNETQRLLANQVDGFLGEFDSVSIKPAPSAIEPVWQPMAKNVEAVILFTSGSTGEPKMVTKTLAALEHELQALDKLNNDSAQVVFSTVSHQHMYGLIFRLFRPFRYQQAFSRTIQEYPEDLIQLAVTHGAFSLVSSPTHLSRLNQQQDWHHISEQCQQVFSSAAALSRADSINASTCLNAPVTEIYGSTETGALAWRCQQLSDSEALWQPLSHVALSQTADETLQVLFKHSQQQVTLADRVKIDEQGQFSLLGRVDRIAKVEGKRLSLSALEQAAMNTAFFHDVNALVLQRARSETAMVGVLTDAGKNSLDQQGRKAFIQQLKQHLAEHFEPVLIPRRWRFVEQMPANTQGKVTMKALTALFDNTAVLWPQIEQKQQLDGVFTLHCLLPENLTYFQGHFDQQSILPGVVQLHWAASYGKQLFAIAGGVIRLEAIKFQQMLLPGQTFSLELRFDEASAKLHFSFQSEHGIHSAGRLCYGV